MGTGLSERSEDAKFMHHHAIAAAVARSGLYETQESRKSFGRLNYIAVMITGPVKTGASEDD